MISQPDLVLGTVDTVAGRYGALLTPKGLAKLTFPGESLQGCRAFAERWWPKARIVPDEGQLQAITAQLQAYFRGERQQFDLPLDLQGTCFQQQVWAALTLIPFGQTRSYTEIAQAVGRPKAVRAVGGANHANPVPIVVPCHRVIGSNGALTGFGGGMDLKQRLLELEGILVRQ